MSLCREDHQQLIEMKAEVARLRSALQTNKVSADRVAELELIIAQLTVELDKERQDKDAVIHERDAIKKDSEVVSIHMFASRISELLFILVF